jgi:hypothetical protein
MPQARRIANVKAALHHSLIKTSNPLCVTPAAAEAK